MVERLTGSLFRSMPPISRGSFDRFYIPLKMICSEPLAPRFFVLRRCANRIGTGRMHAPRRNSESEDL